MKFWAALGIFYSVIGCADMAFNAWAGAAGIDMEPKNDLAYILAREFFHAPQADTPAK